MTLKLLATVEYFDVESTAEHNKILKLELFFPLYFFYILFHLKHWCFFEYLLLSLPLLHKDPEVTPMV